MFDVFADMQQGHYVRNTLQTSVKARAAKHAVNHLDPNLLSPRWDMFPWWHICQSRDELSLLHLHFLLIFLSLLAYESSNSSDSNIDNDDRKYVRDPCSIEIDSE